MAVQYDGLPFRVYVDTEGRLPRPVRQDDKTLSYAADVLIPAGDLEDWEDRQSWFTFSPALGNVGGRITIDVGPGSLSCTIPSTSGDEITGNAILVSISPLANVLGGDFHCSIVLLFLTRPT